MGDIDRIGRLRTWARRRGARRRQALRQWIEATPNLIHVSILVFVPLLIGVVTLLANSLEQLSFLLFPPLASGTFTLFSDPDGPYADPWRFVAGLSLGALCGWVALDVSAHYWYQVAPQAFEVHAGAAALAVFLTGVLTWAMDLEVPAAFSTALLVLVTGTSQLAYVVAVATSSAVVAGGFSIWRDRFYERRAQYLYRTTKGDDHVLVPIVGEASEATVAFASHLAGAHEAGKVVLLSLVETGGPDTAGPEAADGTRSARGAYYYEEDAPDDETGIDGVPGETVAHLTDLEATVESTYDVPCEVAVAPGGSRRGQRVVTVAHETNCDLIVTPYAADEAGAALAPFVRDVFRGDVDAVAFRSVDDRREWHRVLVGVRRIGDIAHATIDFGLRLAGSTGSVSVFSCIGAEGDRRDAERRLADAVEPFTGPLETRVSRSEVTDFLDRAGRHADVTIVGASTDRGIASRYIEPPTFERLNEIPCDLAVVHRA
jgi:hypothetical protein